MTTTIIYRLRNVLLLSTVAAAVFCPPANAAITYAPGNHTGTFVDGSNIYGHGTGATATLVYQDLTIQIPNTYNPYDTYYTGYGTLTFANAKTGPVINPVGVEIVVEGSSITLFMFNGGGWNNQTVEGNMTLTAPYKCSGTEYVWQQNPTSLFWTSTAQATPAMVTINN